MFLRDSRKPQEGVCELFGEKQCNDFAHHSATYLTPTLQRVMVFIMREAGVGKHVEVMI